MGLNAHIQYSHAIILTTSIIAGFLLYSLLSYLFVDPKISITASISLSVLIFGLTNYYNNLKIYTDQSTDLDSFSNSNSSNKGVNGTNDKYYTMEKRRGSVIIFVTIYVVLLLISSLTHEQTFNIFIKWNQISFVEFVQLGIAIMLCFFLPGYAIILIFRQKYKINPLLATLLAYVLSILITGLTSYISALSFDRGVSESKYILIAVYASMLGIFLICYQLQNGLFPIIKPNNYLTKSIVIKYWNYLIKMKYKLTVFGSLFMLIIVSTYLLYGGITIGDQWYHQGRALLFMSGSIKEAAQSGAEAYYPPFQSALLAALTILSGVPLVNAYASIAFLNVIPLFAFYYFFSISVPVNLRKANLIASSLFILSSGFGWIYLLLAPTMNHITSEQSSLHTIGSIADLDIISATNFVIPTAPDFSTALIYIALPAGFILLSMLQVTIHSRFVNIFVVTAVSTLGIIAHYEFYIFIVIACIMPLISKWERKSYLYVSFLISLSIVYLLDIAAPGNFYTYLEILGIPLFLLTGLFVVITWMLYLIRGYVQKTGGSELILQNFRKLHHPNIKFKLIAVTLLVFLVVYVYLLSFIVIGYLPLGTIRTHTDESSVPWYLYPMRMGVAGIFGLIFLLLYLINKFEKIVFVFGVMIIVSIFMGPYYDEARFSKYTMMGLIGFASLMIFKIITWKSQIKPIRNTVILSAIIMSSGLSIFIYIGYGSLILQTQDFSEVLTRRHFPSAEDLHLFEILHGIINTNSEKYNVISFPDEYDRKKDGIIPKIQAFAGLPYDKLHQSPLALNSSTLDALYSNLVFTDARYIVLPRSSIQLDNNHIQLLRFIMDNFRYVYEDKKYIILEVPIIEPPTSSHKARVGLVYSENNPISQIANGTRVLEYSDPAFNFEVNNQTVFLPRENKSGIILSGSEGPVGTTLWTKKSYQLSANTFETRFRTTSDVGDKSNSYTGLKWQKDSNDYFIKLSANGLELYQKSVNDKRYKMLTNNTEFEMKKSILYKIRIESLSNSINVYVNDLLKIQMPIKPTGKNTEEISRIGLTSYRNKVEYMPVKIWSISDSSQEINKFKNYEYNYPLSLLALSKSGYDVFTEDDFSMFAKSTIIVPDSLNLEDSATNRYLDYVHAGGILVVINSDNNFNNTFSRLFSLGSNASNLKSFTNIAPKMNQSFSIGVRGETINFTVPSSPEEKITSVYRNDSNQTIAPFTIEKIFSKGKIILVNAEPYFNSISQHPRQYFYSLLNISSILPLDNGNLTKPQFTALPMQAIIGHMTTSGSIILNSTSISILEDESYPNLLNANKITIFNKTNQLPISFDNLWINNLKMTGNYNVSVNLTGTIVLPDVASNHDYVSFMVPNNFNATVRFHPGILNEVEIFSQNKNFSNPLRLNNDSKIEIYGIKTNSLMEFVPILLKRPELIAYGNTSIRNANFEGYLLGSGRLDDGTELDIQGKIKTKFSLIDHYNEHYRDSTRTKFISYLEDTTMDGIIQQNQESFKLPGDIPSLAIKQGKDLPWIRILSSSVNIFTLMALIAGTVILFSLNKLHNHRIMKGG